MPKRYYRINYEGIDYILYLRWLHEDPWQAVVVKNAASLDEMNTDKAIWSDDIFELHNIHYTDEEIELAKEKVTELFYKYKIDFPE